jgi:RimJ/RimL family protein N-acetyltransferase
MLKRLARAVLGDYSLYRIYALEPASTDAAPGSLDLREVTDMAVLSNARFDEIRALENYRGDDATCFAVFEEDTPVAACWFWFGDTYKQRNFWPLQVRHAKLVQITTALPYRGKGYAPMLLAFAAAEMKQRGFEKLYARIWHSNAPSIAAFEKAGWRYVAFVAELYPFGKTRPWRVVRRRH